MAKVWVLIAKVSGGLVRGRKSCVGWMVCILKRMVDLTQSLNFSVVSRTYHLHSSSSLMHSLSRLTKCHFESSSLIT